MLSSGDGSTGRVIQVLSGVSIRVAGLSVDVDSAVRVAGGVRVASGVTVGLVVGGTSYLGVGMRRMGVLVGVDAARGVA